MAKTYADTYLYKQHLEYEKKIYEFIIGAERINTSSTEFGDVLYAIKRSRISNSLAKIITSNNVVIAINPGKSLPKAFKAFTAADPKDGKKVKLFIDATDCIVFKDGIYKCSKLDWLISYIIGGVASFIYVKLENKLLNNSTILKEGCNAWMRCFSYIIDRMYKTSTVPQIDGRVKYLSCLYYQICILGKDPEISIDSIKANAIKFSGITTSDARVVDIKIEDGDFKDIDTFTNALGRIVGLRDIKTVNIVSQWMNAFGPSTVFALEYFPAFATMMSDTYVGGYLNQQMTIEKIAGPSMIKFTKALIQIEETV